MTLKYSHGHTPPFARKKKAALALLCLDKYPSSPQRKRHQGRDASSFSPRRNMAVHSLQAQAQSPPSKKRKALCFFPSRELGGVPYFPLTLLSLLKALSAGHASPQNTQHHLQQTPAPNPLTPTQQKLSPP